jgi:hypothetical protein
VKCGAKELRGQCPSPMTLKKELDNNNNAVQYHITSFFLPSMLSLAVYMYMYIHGVTHNFMLHIMGGWQQSLIIYPVTTYLSLNIIYLTVTQEMHRLQCPTATLRT